jgi:hypothetical protein
MKKSKPKVKEKKKDDENFDYMKTNKDNIKNIIRDEKLLPIINELTIRTNKIVIHSYQFLKLYLLFLYQNNLPFPILDKEYICDIFKVITKRKCNKGNYTDDKLPEQLKILYDFYKNYYSLTIDNNEILYYDKLPYILAYEAIDMMTNINNNIQEHFINHLNKYVNIVFDIKKQRDEITKNNKDKKIRKQLHKKLYEEINKVKKDLITFNDLKSDIKYHNWIKEQKTKLFPNKIEFKENNIYYELKSNTQYFLYGMFHICNELEKINIDKIKNNEKQIRLFNILPLRTNIIPKNICIDTCGIIQNFMGEDYDSKLLTTYKKQNKYFELWNEYFRLNKKTFKKGKKYTFSHMIRTDGISCCVLFIKVDANGKPLSKTWKNKQCCSEENIDYIETANIENIKNKKVVCADPNMSNLIYCGSYNNKNELETFRYTQNQRRLETRMKKYSKIKDKLNKETIINEKSVKELETTLSSLNSKTCNFEKFKIYCLEKNKINYQLYSHYEQNIFRKLKLNVFINTQKSENKMIKNFEKKYGKPKETVFVMGDFDKGDNHMKGKEPVICKKFRRIFRNAGYKTFLVNEFRTSKLCNCCNEELEKFLERPSHKPKFIKEGKTEICHGLLRCQSVKHECEIFHNRDKNAVQNMLNIVKSVLNTGKRPEIFCREVKNSYPFQDGL